MAISLGLGLDQTRLQYGVGGGFRPASLLGYAAHYRADRVTAEPLFSDDFSDGDASDWSVDIGTITVDAGELQINGTNAVVTQDVSVADSVYTWDETYAGDVGGFVFRHTDNTDTLRVYYNGTTIWAQQLNGGSVLSSTSSTSTSGVTYAYRSVLFGDAWRIYKDDVLLFDITLDATKYAAMSGTKFGPRTSDAGANRWDNIAVRTVDPAVDLQWAADTFAQGDTALAGETTPTGGYTWTGSGLSITSNEVHPTTAGTNSRSYIDWGASDLDMTITFDVGAMDASNDRVGMTYRHTSTTSAWNCWYAGDDNVILEKYDTTPSSVVTTAVTALVADTVHELRAIVVGDDHRILLDGVVVCEYTDALNNTETNHGLYARGSPETDIHIQTFTASAPPLVPCWPDISGEGLHVTQADLTKAPLLLPKVTDGLKPAVVFNAATFTHLQNDAVVLTQPASGCLYYEYADPVSFIMDGSVSGSPGRIIIRSGDLNPQLFAGLYALSTTTPSIGEQIRVSWLADNAASKYRIDTTTDTGLAAGAWNMAGLTIGTDYAGTGAPYTGHVAELILWDADHSDRFGEIDAYLEYWE